MKNILNNFLEEIKNNFKTRNKKFLFGIGFIFLFLVLIFGFQKIFLDQKKLEKNIEISSNWYNLSEKKYLNEKDFSFSEGDIIQRNIFLRNHGIFKVKNFELEDYNVFSDKFISFKEDVKGGKVAILQYKTVARLDSEKKEFNEKILTRLQKIEKTFSVNLEKKKSKNLFHNFFEIKKLGKKTLNNNFNEFLEIYGKNLDSIENILIFCDSKAEIFEITKRDEGKISVLIKENSLEPGVCQVGTELGGIGIFSNLFVNITKDTGDNGVFLKHITPNKVTSKKGGMIVLQGKGFDKLVAIQIDNGVVLDLEFLEVLSENVVAVNIPKKMKEGEYFFRFLTKDGVYENKKLKIFVE